MKRILIFLIQLYRYFLSPLMPMSCRFTPTCSEYSLEALQKYGIVRGVYLTGKRLLRCHPFHPGGYDPVRGHEESCEPIQDIHLENHSDPQPQGRGFSNGVK